MTPPKIPEVSDAVVLLMDDPKSLTERRAVLAGIINDAVAKRAAAVVLDVFFKSPTDQDSQLLAAIKNAKDNNVKIFMVTPPDGSPSLFQGDGIVLGHNFMIGEQYNGIPSPNSYMPLKAFSQGGEIFPFISLEAAQEVCGESSIRPDINRPVSYADLGAEYRLKIFSYTNYGDNIKDGAVVFVGGVVAPGTGEPVDKVLNDEMSVTNGVFDIVSAFYGACTCMWGIDMSGQKLIRESSKALNLETILKRKLPRGVDRKVIKDIIRAADLNVKCGTRDGIVSRTNLQDLSTRYADMVKPGLSNDPSYQYLMSLFNDDVWYIITKKE